MAFFIVYLSLLLTFTICTALAAYVWPYRRSPMHRFLIILQSIYALWALLLLFIIFVDDFESKILLTKARQIFLPFISPLWAVTVIGVFFSKIWEKWARWSIVLFIVPMIVVMANLASMLGLPGAEQWTFYDFQKFENVYGLLTYKSGSLISYYFTYLYIVLVIFYGVYLLAIFKGRGARKTYAIVLTLAATSHLAFDLSARYLFHSTEMIQLSVAAVWPMALGLYYSVTRLEFLDISVLAQQRVYENLPSPVLIIKADSTFWDANKSATKVFGLQPSMVGKKTSEIPELKELLENPSALTLGERHYRVAWQTLRSREGEKAADVYLLNDVTDILKLNSDLQEGNHALRDLNDEILKVMHFNQKIHTILSHDLSGSLLGINSLLENLKAKAQIRGEQEWATSLDKVTQASDSSRRLLSDVLVWSREDRAHRPINVVSILETTIRQLEPQIMAKDISVEFLPSQESILLLASKHILGSIFRNLLSNAIRYSQPHDVVTIECLADDNEIVIKFIDRGLGMDEKTKTQILQKESFEDRHYDELGIGLKFTINFIEKLDGRLFIDSTLGKGSIFTVRVPRA
ncbi:ATP-binding protein [Bdellovibrio sp.]|uniref:sensor histidine kinase n=1 Tax=Bdellovibrio sp. TaxID=28201 RepID=UPI0039E50EB6